MDMACIISYDELLSTLNEIFYVRFDLIIFFFFFLPQGYLLSETQQIIFVVCVCVFHYSQCIAVDI